MSDDKINAALLRVQAALAGIDMETALNALAIQAGYISVLGADSKGDALACIRGGQSQSRKVVNDLWGRPDMELMRRQLRGETVQ